MTIEEKFKQANKLHIDGSFKEALIIYHQINEVLNKRVDLLEHLIGIAYYQLNNLELAYKYINRAIEINNKNADYFSNLGLVLRDMKKLDESIESFEKSLKINPTHIDALNGIGTVYAKRKDWENALIFTQKSFYIKKNKDNISNLALYYLSINNLEEAERYNNIAINEIGCNINNLNNKARILHAKGFYKESLSEYENLLNIFPDNDEIRINATNIALAMGSLEMAQKFITGFSPVILDKKLLESRLYYAKREIAQAIHKAEELVDTYYAGKYSKILGVVAEKKSIDFSKSKILLNDLDKILIANDIEYFIAFGTLLGITREGDILKHDKDLDVGIINILNFEVVKKVLIESGKFILSERSFFQKNNNLFTVVHEESKLALDVFNFVETENDKLKVSLDQDIAFEWLFEKISIERIKFKDIELNSVKEPEIFLNKIYGSNWRFPDPLFDSVVEGLNLSSRSKEISIYYSLMRLYKAILTKSSQKEDYYIAILKNKYEVDLKWMI